MRYLSRKLLLCAVAVIVMCSLAGAAFAIDSVGTFEIVSESDAGSYSSLEGMEGSEWHTSVAASEIPVLQDSRDIIVLTIPTLEITASPSDSATKQFIAKVSYDFSVLSESVYADTENTLTFYPVYTSTSAGTAKFYNASMDELTAYDINTNKALTAGYIVMTLTSGDTYTPFVAVRSTSGLVINAASTSFDLYNGGTQEVNLTVSNYTGNVAWEIISSSDSSSYYPVQSSIASSDSGHSAVLTFTVPANAEYQQDGVVEIAATDQTSGAQATITILYNVEPKLTITLSSDLVSVDLDDTLRVPLGLSGSYGSVTYEANDDWITFDDYFFDTDDYAVKSADIILSPTGRFLQGGTWSVDITASDSRASWDKRGIDVVTLRVHVYGALSLDVSSSAFTISSGDVPEVTFTAHNAQGDLSFDVSESWASVVDSKFVVVGSIDESLQGTTQEVTVTARDDRGRDGNPRGESSVVLSVTISKDAVPALELALSPASLTVDYDGSGTATLTPSNVIGTVSYSSSASWAIVDGDTITVIFDSSYAGTTQTATITATDSGRTSDNTATAELSVTFGTVPPVPDDELFRLSISTATMNVNPGGSGTATLTPENALGTVSYTSSASWVNIFGDTVTVHYDSAYAGTTQTATITATDSGRTSANTRTVQLSVTFGNSDYILVLNINKQILNIRAGVNDSINLSLTGAESAEGVTWSYGYDSVPSGADPSSNPLDLSFGEESSTFAVLNVNPGSDAVPGTYTVHVYTSTTSGTSTGGDSTINITVHTDNVFSILLPNPSVSYEEGSSFTLSVSAQNAQGTPSWRISSTSWGSDSEPVILTLSDTEGTSITVSGLAVTAGDYSFVVEAVDGNNTASVNVSLTVTKPSKSDEGTTNTSRANKAPSITIRAVELTQEVVANLRASLGLSASQDIRTLTAENILSAASPDIETESAMNRLGYQLAANLSRIRVTESGLYAFVFSIPIEYVGFSMNDLAVFAKTLQTNEAYASEFSASAAGENGLNEGDLVGTDGRRITTSVTDMLAVLDLEAGTTSGTFFGSVIIPEALGLDELNITTAEIDDAFKENLAENERITFNVNELRSIEESNIFDPIEPTQEIIQSIKNEDGYDLAYKLNTIIVSEDGWYAFSITLPDEIVGLSSKDISVYTADMSKLSSSQVKSSALISGIASAVEVDMFGLKLDTVGKKLVAIAFLQAGTPFSVYLGKLLIMLLLGGCETGTTSYAGYGIIALAGVVILLGARMLRRR